MRKPARIRSLTYMRTRNGRPNPSHERQHRAAGQGLGTKVYVQRNPRVKSVISRLIEAARANGAQPGQIQEFYDRIDRVQRTKDIRAEPTWDIDEAGTALGICTNSMVLETLKSSVLTFRYRRIVNGSV